MTLAMTTRAKLAALAIVAPALFLPMKAAAQQATASQPDYSVCEPLRGSATRPGAFAQCLQDTLRSHTRQLQEHTRQMQTESAQAREETSCGNDLMALRAANPAVVERGRAILAGRPAKDFGMCNLLRALRQG